MNKIHFEWDSSKARSNKLKHKVSFAEAKTVFYDESAVEFMMMNIQNGKIDFYCLE